MDSLEEDGILLVDKPVGWTSFDVVGKIRGGLRVVFGRKMKVGHAGTLDPLASGLLVVGYGRKTKELEALAAQEKTYTGTLRLGEITPSHDAETPVTGHKPWEHLSAGDIRAAVGAFSGEILQRPPLYSAKHHQGERAYFLAREGAANELTPVKVLIHRIEVLGIRGQEVDFEVTCGKGTYIRALAHDIGQALGCGAWLCALRRTRSGAFDVAGSRTPEAWSMWFDHIKMG
jgi:tRNA pseudouridine55 synthase